MSDILPYELPFIFSNRYFYRFLVKNGIKIQSHTGDNENTQNKVGQNSKKKDLKYIVWNKDIHDGALQILSFILGVNINTLKNKNTYQIDLRKFQTIPFTYRILHKPTKSRELSIIHPKNQILMCDFYDQYKTLILYYCSLDKFSLRFPNKVACYFFFRDKLHKTLIGRKSDSLELFYNEYENLRTFFSYKHYNNIYKFYEDYRYQRAEKKFDHLLKFDIQSCFDRIYTHSIAWAVGGGKAIYKHSFRGTDNIFGSKWDKQMQLMNYNETNGIVIGPEFSRIFAEIILQHIDNFVEQSLNNEKFEFGRDYICYRYVDDYFFFYNAEECRKKAIELFDGKFKEYKLSISAEKTHEFSRPFITDITRAKNRIDKLIHDEIQYHSVQSLPEGKADAEVDADVVDEDTIDLVPIEKAIQDRDWIHLNSLKFNQEFKTILVECNVKAKDIINYTLSRLGNKLTSVIKKFNKTFRLLSIYLNDPTYRDLHLEISNVKRKKENMITSFFEEILDVTFFLYSSSKQVNTTLKVINILNLMIINLDNDYEIDGVTVSKYSGNARDTVFRKILDELSLILRTTSVDPNTQLETLYFLIINKQLRSKYHFTPAELTVYLEKLSLHACLW